MAKNGHTGKTQQHPAYGLPVNCGVFFVCRIKASIKVIKNVGLLWAVAYVKHSQRIC